MPPPLSNLQTIVYFDGYCNLCNAAIDFLIRHDPEQRLYFASLQGATAAQRLPPALVKDLNSLALQRGGRIFTHSAAALMAAQTLGGGLGALASVGLWIPRLLRDPLYRLVARYRYRWFGRRDTCRLPSPSEMTRFLP